MKQHLIVGLAVAIMLTVGLAAWAQEADARRQRWEKRRQAMQQAIEAVQADAGKLQAAMESAAKVIGDMGSWQDLSDDERAKLREDFGRRREQWRSILGDMELQIARLKGSRQLRSEHEQALKELRAIRDLADSEKATAAAAGLGAIIEKRETEFAKTLTTLGFEE